MERGYTHRAMRDSTKVIIGLGSIWGVFVLGGTILASFAIGAKDTTPEVVALIVSGFGILPCCLLAIWRRRIAAWSLLGIAAVCGYGFTYQTVFRRSQESSSSLLGNAASALLFTCIPGLIGFLLLRATNSVVPPP